MSKEPLQWLTVDDFSAGIVSDLRRAAGKFVPSANPGAASETNTYRCLPLPAGGGLGPGPIRDYSYSRGSIPAGTLQTGREFVLSGFYVAGPLNTGAGSTRGHEFFFGIEWLTSGPDTRNWTLERFPVFASSPTLDTAIDGYTSTTSFQTLNQYVTVKFVTTMSNNATPTSPGIPVVVYGYNAPGPLNPSVIGQFPSETATSTTGVHKMWTNAYYPALMIAHQHRVLWGDQRNFNHGAVADGKWLNNEYIFFTEPNDVRTLNSATPSQFSPENPSGYGTGESMSANELFLVKKKGGGVMIRGSLADPTVTTLPNVASSDRTKGARTRMGFIYASESGDAYVWNGGDQSQPVSTQLSPFFYLPDNDPNIFLDDRSVWAAWGSEFLVTSNLYMLDLEQGGWWRLDNPADLRQGIWNIQAPNYRHLYGCTYSFTASDQALVYGWDSRSAAKSWSWQGHPFMVNDGDREIEIREVLLRGAGNGTITWTPILRDGTTGQAETFTFSSDDTPVTIRRNVAIDCQAIHYRLESAGAAGTPQDEAPVLHWIKFGWHERRNIPAADQS